MIMHVNYCRYLVLSLAASVVTRKIASLGAQMVDSRNKEQAFLDMERYLLRRTLVYKTEQGT